MIGQPTSRDALGLRATVSRRTHARTSQRRVSTPQFTKRQRPTARNVDAEVLVVREGGASYSAIARTLTLGRAVDAHRSFVHALSAYDGDERKRLIASEVARLDRLERRIRDRDAADADKVRRRLLGVDKLREAMQP